MTTIVYDHNLGLIAYDSRVTMDDVILTDDAEKRVDMDTVQFFMASDERHETAFINAWMAGDPLGSECDVQAIVVEGERVSLGRVVDGVLVNSELTCSWAIGSGAQYAIGAMDAGSSAIEAVEIASHRDPGTGGRIRTYKVYDK